MARVTYTTNRATSLQGPLKGPFVINGSLKGPSPFLLGPSSFLLGPSLYCWVHLPCCWDPTTVVGPNRRSWVPTWCCWVRQGLLVPTTAVGYCPNNCCWSQQKKLGSDLCCWARQGLLGPTTAVGFPIQEPPISTVGPYRLVGNPENGRPGAHFFRGVR